MKENWKDIPGYDGKYQVNTEGEVRRIYKSGKTKHMTPYCKKKNRGNRRLIVKLTRAGKAKEAVLMQIVAEAFLGPVPEGCVPYHKNGCQSDNYVQNIAYIGKKELGKINGARSRRKPVAKLDNTGQIIAVYTSAREAARQNYCSYQTVIDRCNGKVKKSFGDVDYAWEDSENSMRWAARRLELNVSN